MQIYALMDSHCLEASECFSWMTTRILDHRPIRTWLLRASTETAASASEAMRQMRTVKPDVVITDFAMPGGDGYELLRRVRSLPPEHGDAVPAALVTAAPLEAHRTLARGAGFSEVTREPVDLDAFCSLVAALAEQDRNRQQQRRSA
jgi:CheY-like chemotaxis protein